MSKKSLFVLWGGLFILCAGLGFVPEHSFLMTAAALGFFVPPAMLVYRARKARDGYTLMLIRNLSVLSLGLTAVLLILNFVTAFGSETLGIMVHSLLVIVSSPMICGGNWAMSLFLWACLLMVSSRKK